MWKTVLVTALVPVALLAACGGGGGGSANSGGGGIGGGSCTAMFPPFVTNASECWEYSTDESNA
ncbi:MAG: thioredoxine reductase, partial [Nitrospinota bacterium]